MTSMTVSDCLRASKSLLKMSLKAMPSKSILTTASVTLLRAEEFRVELTRDAFITGLDSSTIRQRLLEGDTLSFQSAVTKALVLERAQKSFFSPCGKIHSPSQCPARDAYCFNCGKRGHFQVCLAKPEARAQKILFSPRTDRANIVSTSLPETSTDSSSDIPDTVAAINAPCLLSLTSFCSCG